MSPSLESIKARRIVSEEALRINSGFVAVAIVTRDSKFSGPAKRFLFHGKTSDAVYIISECDCDMLSLDNVMCPDYQKAVVYTAVERLEHSDANGNRMYRMLMEVTYKEGDYALNVSDVRITMRFPPNGMLCGYTFSADNRKGYIIADVGSDGILSSDMCQYVRPSQEVFKESDSKDLLDGRRKPSCQRGDS